LSGLWLDAGLRNLRVVARKILKRLDGNGDVSEKRRGNPEIE
jgi:hypothetical protein